MAHEEFHGPPSNPLRAVKDEVNALEVAEVIGHHPGDEALQLLHVEGTRDVWLIRAGNRTATHTHTCYHNYRVSSCHHSLINADLAVSSQGSSTRSHIWVDAHPEKSSWCIVKMMASMESLTDCRRGWTEELMRA